MAQITYRDALRQALREELERDQHVFVIGAGVGYFGGAFRVSEGLMAAFGERRVRDLPNSAATIIGAGIGAAFGGLRPVVELTLNDESAAAILAMIAGALRSVASNPGKLKLPVVFRMAHLHAGAVSEDQPIERFLITPDRIRVAAPATPADAKGLLKSAIRGDDPVIFVEHESLYDVTGEVSGDADFLTPFGQANVIRGGKDVTIVAYSRGVRDALDAASSLAQDNIEADVIDLRTLNPLDLTTVVESVRRTRRTIVVSECGGAGAEIDAQIYRSAYGSLAAPIERVRGAEIVECARRMTGDAST